MISLAKSKFTALDKHLGTGVNNDYQFMLAGKGQPPRKQLVNQVDDVLLVGANLSIRRVSMRVRHMC